MSRKFNPDQLDVAQDGELTVTVLIAEYRELVRRNAYLEGYVRGLIEAINDISLKCNNIDENLGENVENCIRDLIDKEFDKRGKDNA